MKVFVFLFATLFASPAFACPMLESANPKVGSEVAGANVVELKFSEEIYPENSTVVVTDTKGAEYNIGKPYGDENLVAVKLKPLPPGKYKVEWNVACDCGSLRPGDYNFEVK